MAKRCTAISNLIASADPHLQAKSISSRLLISILLGALSCAFANGAILPPPPKDVPPVIGTAVIVPSSRPGGDDVIRLTVPKVAWEVVGERKPKREWPKFRVEVEEAVLNVELEIPSPATQRAPIALNRVLNLNGRALSRDEAVRRLAVKTAVLVSVSGKMPDLFYLQCTKPDTLIVSLGILHAPAPELLPAPKGGNQANRPRMPLIDLPIRYPAGMNKSYTGGMPTTVRLNPKRVHRPHSLRVPLGTTNIAAGKRVIASDPEPIQGELHFITDGNKSGRDSSILVTGVGKEWIQIDLGQNCEVFAVGIWRHPYTWSPHVYRDVVVVLADDPECTKNVRVIFNNDHDNTLGLGKGSDYEYYDERNGKIITCYGKKSTGQHCRYVRIWSNGRITGKDIPVKENQYAEIEVYGLP